MRLATFICLAMAAINVPFIVHDPTQVLNWAAALFCVFLAIVNATGGSFR